MDFAIRNKQNEMYALLLQTPSVPQFFEFNILLDTLVAKSGRSRTAILLDGGIFLLIQ